jgi:hypothetical protein
MTTLRDIFTAPTHNGDVWSTHSVRVLRQLEAGLRSLHRPEVVGFHMLKQVGTMRIARRR